MTTRYTKRKVIQRIMKGMTVDEIIKSFPKVNVNIREIESIKNKSIKLKDIIMDGIIHRKCNTCGSIKPHTLEFFIRVVGSKKWVWCLCKYCQSVIRKNKSILDPNFKEKQRIRGKKYREDNKEAIKERRLNKNITPEQLQRKRKLARIYSRKKYREKQIGVL